MNDELEAYSAMVNSLARYYHRRLHKSAKTWFCASDRDFAVETIQLLASEGWLQVNDEDHRSS